jgi:hypothetical protein
MSAERDTSPGQDPDQDQDQPIIQDDDHNLEAYADDFSDSEDGGMYLDLDDPEAAIYYPTERDPEFGPQQIIRDDRYGKFSAIIAVNFHFFSTLSVQAKLTYTANQFSARAPQPNSYSQQQNQNDQLRSQGPPIEKDAVTEMTYRPYVETEEEHAALTVLNDPELLAMYACKSNLVS